MTGRNFFLIVIFLSFGILNFGAIPASERAALVAIYNATEGNNWVSQAGWKEAPLDADGFAASGTEGEWYGVTVTADKVTQIILSGNNLKGTIPMALMQLTSLQILNLNNNQLTGSIPVELAGLKKLLGLHMYGNSLSGVIPSQLGELSQLTILLLNKNKLTGGIPTQLGKLSKLIGLYLADNQLSGPIPVELGNLSLLKSIDLSKNRLSGTIPVQMGNFRQLIILNIANNQLSGTLPTQLGNLSNIEDFRVSNNRLSGSIPSQFTSLVKLSYLLLDHNQFSGEIPANFKNLTNVSGLDIGYNCLTSTNAALITWLNRKDPDWKATQGTCSTTVSITLDRTQLIFGATPTGVSTAPQIVYLNKVGSSTLNWNATSDVTWIAVAPAAGIDSGTLSISVNAAGLGAGNYYGNVSVTATNASNSPQNISVIMNVYNSGGTTAPVGELSTPQEGATTYNSVPVTGWVIDDIGVSAVKIYNGDSYIGEAIFVEGARPDVQVAFPTYPNNSKAGWGYMLLTHFLPGGGNGTYTLSARATDIEGNEVVLGSKTITIDNANAKNPFGAIDTPAQGGTVSGKDFVNYGWALTPKPNTIPTDGSTINVVVDGVVKGHPGYNVYRSDIATLFPGYNNTNGAIGYFYLDTTTMTNGIHSISWNVTDNAGNSDGAGSRYFSIMNTSGSDVATQAASDFIEPTIPNFTATVPFDADSTPLQVRYGTNRKNSPCPIEADQNGNHELQIKELECVQVKLGDDYPVDTGVSLYGYLVVGNELRPLPVGSTLDRQKGVFYWQPGPGFIGRYHLLFIQKDDRQLYTKKNIVVTVLPLSSSPQ